MFAGLNDFFSSCSLLLKTLEAFIGYKLQTSTQSQQAANCVTSICGLSSFSKVALLTKRQSMALTNLKMYVVKCSDFVPQGTGALRITNKVSLPLWNIYYNHGKIAVRNQLLRKQNSGFVNGTKPSGTPSHWEESQALTTAELVSSDEAGPDRTVYARAKRHERKSIFGSVHLRHSDSGKELADCGIRKEEAFYLRRTYFI